MLDKYITLCSVSYQYVDSTITYYQFLQIVDKSSVYILYGTFSSYSDVKYDP